MKVFCINDSGWVNKKRTWRTLWLFKKDTDTTGPSYGDVCTVTGKEYGEGDLFYFLLEWPNKSDDSFSADQFIPISEIDEMELVKERETQLQTIN